MAQVCIRSIGIPLTVKLMRERMGLDQQEFADALGVSKSTVSNWETGATDLSAEKLLAVARKAGYDLTLSECV